MAALAAILEGRGQFTKAERFYRWALTVFRRASGPKSYEVAVNLAGLAGVHHATRRDASAERLYTQSLVAILRRLFGRHHVEVALTVNNLGLLQAARGRPTERLSRPALPWRRFRRACGVNHPSTLLAASNVEALASLVHNRAPL